jgi:predicted RNase H-like HicB family nuclease
MEYAAVFEKLPRNWCAYVPDLPGCVSTGGTSYGGTSYGVTVTVHSILRMIRTLINRSRRASMKYAVVFEKAPRNRFAYVPDPPGCVSTRVGYVEA